MAGIDKFRFHDLRHAFNTNMRQAGGDQSVVMKLTGHKTPRMFQHDNTVDLADAKEAYQKLEVMLRQGQEHQVNKVLPWCSQANNKVEYQLCACSSGDRATDF
jgi:hypothetical protein